MAYKSRKKNFGKSKSERIRQHWRNVRVTVIFILITIAILVFKNRISIWNYIQTYFY